MLLNFAFLSQKLIDSKEMFLKFWMFSAKSVVSFICDEISHKKLLFVAATSSLRGRILEGFWAEKYHSLSTPKYSFSLRSYLSRSVFIIFHQKKYFTVYFFFLYVHKITFSSFLVLTRKFSSTLLPFLLMRAKCNAQAENAEEKNLLNFFFPSNFTFVAVIFPSYFLALSLNWLLFTLLLLLFILFMRGKLK